MTAAKLKKGILAVLKYFTLILGAFVSILPLVVCVITAFKSPEEYASTNVMTLPKSWTYVENFIQAWKQANFATYTMNSVFLSLAVMLISLINASIISLVVFIYNFFMLGDRGITASVSLSLFAVVMFASIFGTLVPMTLDKMKIDPALATGPFITITNDIIGMMIYMFITSALA